MNKLPKLYTAITEGLDSKIIACEIVKHADKTVTFSLMGISPRFKGNFKKKLFSIFNENNIKIEIGHYIINLLPIDVNKEGALFDLPLAISILLAADKLSPETINFLQDCIVVGELSLTGEVFPIKNALSLALQLSKLKKKKLILPSKNSKECSLLPQSDIYLISHINDIFDIKKLNKITSCFNVNEPAKTDMDINQVYGQQQAKRALEIAAAGKHNILFYGPPGAGKTMLAQRITTILPKLTDQQIIETTRIYSAAGLLHNGEPITTMPFRRPHHTTTTTGMLGGGITPQIGEISLAHNGVLFMDEFLEFKEYTIEALRECIEEKKIHIKRANYSVCYPASFILIAALNPCPCGFFGDKNRECVCSPTKIRDYLKNLSGPILDRIDMQVQLHPVDFNSIQKRTSDSSASVFARVKNSIDIQFARNKVGIYNGTLQDHDIDKKCKMSDEAHNYIKKQFDIFHLSMRGYHKIIKISRTIADLECAEIITKEHIQEALMYRSFDKFIEKFDVTK